MPIKYSQYHPKWTLIRRMVLRRAGYRCEECRAENQAPVASFDVEMPTLFNIKLVEPPRRMIVLNVAHLDHDRNNNRFSNLKCLCLKCHLRHDLAQRVYSFRYGKETQYMNGKLF